MDVVFLLARILFVYLFLTSAVGHLTKTDAMTGYTQSRGVPSPKPAVIASGLLMLVGGLLVLLGVWADLGALFLAAFTASAALLMHAFWKESDPMARQMETIQFNKDVALTGAGLAFFVIFQADPGLTLAGPLFS
jgi:putative oxidoreductase